MDDEIAYMERVKSNSQGELSALEIGIHSLGSLEKSQGKKGSGLKLYAGEIGKSNDSIEQWTKAASGFFAFPTRVGRMNKTNHGTSTK